MRTFGFPKATEARIAFVLLSLMMVLSVLQMSGIIEVRILLRYAGLCMFGAGVSGICYLLRNKKRLGGE